MKNWSKEEAIRRKGGGGYCVVKFTALFFKFPVPSFINMQIYFKEGKCNRLSCKVIYRCFTRNLAGNDFNQLK